MKFKGMFKALFGADEEESGFVGLQLVILNSVEDNIRARIHSAIAAIPSEQSAGQKWKFYKETSDVLLELLPFAEYGYWDVIDNPQTAEQEFNQWVDDIDSSAIDQETGGATEDWNDTDRIDTDKHYIVVSILFLLQQKNSFKKLNEFADSVEESAINDRTTYSSLLQRIKQIDFTTCISDAIFVMPGNDTDGFSWTDMRAEGWEYLKPIF